MSSYNIRMITYVVTCVHTNSMVWKHSVFNFSTIRVCYEEGAFKQSMQLVDYVNFSWLKASNQHWLNWRSLSISLMLLNWMVSSVWLLFYI